MNYFKIDRLKGILNAQLTHDKLVTIDIDVPSDRSLDKNDPWIANMGIFQDDPTFDDFLAEINTYRDEITSGRLRQRHSREPFMTLYVLDTNFYGS